jgi:hypothetical protein
MNLYETATGDCVQCGGIAEGSKYWTPLPSSVWKAVRPHLLSIFGDENRIPNLFIPPYSKPFCGAGCSTKHYEENNRWQ